MRMISYRLIILLLVLLAMLLPGWAQYGDVDQILGEDSATTQYRETERILDFHSLVTVNKDSTMTVSETIRVEATGDQIEHFIYRDFPTSYWDKRGNCVNISFQLYSVSHDGSPEPYHTVKISNGVRICIGNRKRLIGHCEHTYQLTYGVTQELGFFKDHDELYWNVTGNGWGFPIDRASATVILPTDIPRKEINVEGYTGAQGSEGQEYRARVDTTGQARFETTHQLRSYEGLTIVVTFPKGYITPPSTTSKINDFFQDNCVMLVAFIGFLVVLGYYLTVWINYGRDLPAGTIIPRYTPPEGLSPAGLRYVRKMGYDNKAFATAIINLAVKGRVTISEGKENKRDKDGWLFGDLRFYTITKLDTPPQPPQGPRAVIEMELKRGASTSFAMLAQQAGVKVAKARAIVDKIASTGMPIIINGDSVRMYVPAVTATDSTPADTISVEEEALLTSLFTDSYDSIELKDTNYVEIQPAISSFRSSLQSRYENRFFTTNAAYAFPGVLLSLLILLVVGAVAFSQNGEVDSEQFFGSLMLTLISLGLFIFKGVPLWRMAFTRGGIDRIAYGFWAILVTILLSIFFVVGITLVEGGGLPSLVLVAAAFTALNGLFYHLMKAPTVAGRKLLGEIEGFRIYLNTAEKDEMNLSNPPEKTPELFEKYLPYALALDVEQRWVERFAGILARATVDVHR